MAIFLQLSLFAALASLVTAEVSLAPSNDTLPNVEVSQILIWKGSSMQLNRSLYPLGANAGLGQKSTYVQDISRTGNLQVVVNGDTSNVDQGEIAYLSCDPVNLTTTNLEYNAILTTLASIAPKAVVLYSLTSEHCNISDLESLTPQYTSIYTMTSRLDSVRLLDAVDDENALEPAAIVANSTVTGSESSSVGNTGSSTAPTTAVAMSILYSITGIITLLFLIIIATGAIRAHRHPERYGPRNGQLGRPRQSRAKGLARAMLETIPIVKFGDPEPTKPGHQDLELENGTVRSQDNIEPVAAPVVEVGSSTETDKKGASEVVSKEVLNQTPIESGLGPDTQAESAAAAVTGSAHDNEGAAVVATVDDDHLGCSICTEDFSRGEDVRVLPCNHKYHPACIDPWLLNVSGTCPLCRVDLRPVQSNTTEFPPGTAGSDLPPPLPETQDHSRRRVSRLIDFNLIRSAPPDERIAALRRMRAEERGGDTGGLSEDVGRRGRLTGRLRDAFGIRTRAVESNEHETNNV